MRRRRSTVSAAGEAQPGGLVYRPAETETEEIRGFLASEWPAADRDVFGPDGLDWTSRPVVVEARDGGELVAVAVGEVVAGTARLGDILVARSRRSGGVGGRLLELFCERAAAAGAARCYLRCPDTPRHRRFYQRHGFARIARLPRYYHGKDFLEYLREPLLPQPGRRGRGGRGAQERGRNRGGGWPRRAER
ncbi:MAG TPA: GNAT family N-acetyltransferase [Actinomycetes bacterium]